jgi:hypothetical protein
MRIPQWVLDEPGEAVMLPRRLAPRKVALSKPVDFWRLATREDFYTTITPPLYSFDENALKLARTVCPDIQVIWRKQLWHPPGERTATVQVVHVGIARYVPYTRNKVRLLHHVERPAGSTVSAPNLIEFIFADDAKDPGGPQGYQPFDMEGAHLLVSMFSGDKTPAEVDEEHYQRKLAAEARRQKAISEHMAASEEILRHADKALADLTTADEHDIMRLQAEERRKHRETGTGLIKPFALLGR